MTCPALTGILGDIVGVTPPIQILLCPNGVCLPLLGFGNRAWRGALRKCPLGLACKLWSRRCAHGAGGGNEETDGQTALRFLAHLPWV